ncbi:MAG: DUF3553 domain-containing protein [Phycisphaerales bacterium JB039]
MTSWRPGDRVIHTGKPEWGVGAVESAAAAVENGSPCQRLRVRFARAGTKILSTAYATLAAAQENAARESAPYQARSPRDEETPDMNAKEQAGSWLAALEAKPITEQLIEVPEPARDPFLPLTQRLKNALDLYRFRAEGASLLDWAAMQTQLKDPLSAMSRHELEEYFRRFRHALDQHTADLAAELKRQNPAALDRLLAAAPEEGQRALRRNLARR